MSSKKKIIADTKDALIDNLEDIISAQQELIINLEDENLKIKQDNIYTYKHYFIMKEINEILLKERETFYSPKKQEVEVNLSDILIKNKK